MNMKRSTILWLALIFILVFGVRLLFAFNIDGVSYESYNILRNVENIKNSGVPLFNDELSYGGREKFFSPVYHYILAGFSYLFNDFFLIKVIPNFFISFTVIVVFFLVFALTEDEFASILASLFSGFIPILFNSTLNTGSVYSLVVPVFFLCCYYFLRTNQNEKYLWKLLVSLIFMAILHPLSLVLAVVFLVYLFFIKVFVFRESKREAELVLFYFIFILWLTMVFYRLALSNHGFGVIWQNLPLDLLRNSFANVTVVGALFGIGFIPLILGLAGLYMNLFNFRSKGVTLMMSVCFVFFLLVYLNWFPLHIGLMFLGVALTVSSGNAFSKFLAFVFNLKSRVLGFIAIFVLFCLLLISFFPSMSTFEFHEKDTPSREDFLALYWLKNNSAKNSSVLSLSREGSFVSYVSGLKNVIDEDYLLISNVNKRFEDLNGVYEDVFLTDALETLSYYDVDYVFLSKHNFLIYNNSRLLFAGNECVPLVFGNKEDVPKIYKIRCGFSYDE